MPVRDSLEPGENAQLRQWRRESRKKKPVGHGAAQGGARGLRPGAGGEPGGDAAGGGGEEQAQQVAQLHARALCSALKRALLTTCSV